MKHLQQILQVVAFLAILIGTPALGLEGVEGEQMSPESFRDYAEGYTLYFEREGQPWGAERFEGDGRVTWRYPSGECISGVWKAHEGRACFYYGPGSDVFCWGMRRRGDGLTGRLESDVEEHGMEIDIVRRDRLPLSCGAPGADL